VRGRAALAILFVTAASLASCTRTRVVVRQVGRLPPVPTSDGRGPVANEPPVIWIGGTLSQVDTDRLQVRDSLGTLITVRRLGAGATAFFSVSGAQWRRLADTAAIEPGGLACVETLMDGLNLLALRVFLGASCGPA
jgi:hypothetical protein